VILVTGLMFSMMSIDIGSKFYIYIIRKEQINLKCFLLLTTPYCSSKIDLFCPKLTPIVTETTTFSTTVYGKKRRPEAPLNVENCL
jgi:hypothetical protein